MLTRDWTATVFIVDQDRILLVRHRKLNTWLPPGGHIDSHELPHLAAIREVREETGLEIALLGEEHDLGEARVLPQPLCILLETIAPDHEHIDLIYVGWVIGGSLAHAEAEHHAARWWHAHELDDPSLLNNVRQVGKQALAAMAQATGLPGSAADNLSA